MSNFQHHVLNPTKAATFNQCLTGCTYRIVPTEGPNGKNVLKLIPVSKSTDTFIPIVQPNVIPNGSPVNVNLPAGIPLLSPVQSVPLSPPVKIPVVPQQPQPGFGNYLIATAPGNLHITPETGLVDHKGPPPQNTTVILEKSYVNVAARPPFGNPTFVMVNTNSPSITLKPANMLPSGHHLQIPANAEVRSVPASLLPTAIQQKILAATSCGEVKNPSVIYVSPVNTVRTLVTNQLTSVYPKPCPATISPAIIPSPTAQSPCGSQQPGGARSPKAPMKWIVQENKESSSCLVPVKSSNDTASKILKMLSGKPGGESNIASVLPVSSNVIHIKDNALVMYNNKIYLLAKRGSEVFNSQPCKPASPEKPPEPAKDLSNKVVEVVLSKNKVGSPSSADPSEPQGVKPQSAAQHPNKPELHAQSESSVLRFEDAFVAQTPSAISKQKSKEVHSPRPESSVKTNVTARPSPKPAGNTQGSQPISASLSARKGQSLPMTVTDRSLRRSFGLRKKEKVILRRFPMLRQRTPSKADNKINATATRDNTAAQIDTWSSGSGDNTEYRHIKRKVSQSPQRNAKRLSVTFKEDPDIKKGFPEPQDNPDSPSRSPVAVYSSDIPETATSTSADHPGFSIRETFSASSSKPFPTSSRLCASPVDLDDTVRDEKIWRLKELLREREEALEAIRQKMSS